MNPKQDSWWFHNRQHVANALRLSFWGVCLIVVTYGLTGVIV